MKKFFQITTGVGWTSPIEISDFGMKKLRWLNSDRIFLEAEYGPPQKVNSFLLSPAATAKRKIA